MTTTKDKAAITIPVQISEYQLKGVLCSAFEGGTGYWCRIDGYNLPEGVQFRDVCPKPDEAKAKGAKYWHYSQIIPLIPGASLKLTTTEDPGIDGYGNEWEASKEEVDELGNDHRRYLLTREKIESGLKLMAEKYPKHFADIIIENDDADTGDVLVQMALFGEIVFG